MSESSTYRFSDRVDHYIKTRPHYPVGVIELLVNEGVLFPESIIADVGSGTGISSEPFLKEGYTVYGIEPNKEMREAGERQLLHYKEKGFISINGTAEKTTLDSSSVDTIICGQAFHWFNKETSKTEFQRILRKPGFVVLMWNDRRTDSTDFLKVYEDFLQLFGTDYTVVDHKNTQKERVFEDFFGHKEYQTSFLYNFQDLDFEALKGRVLSSSYMPNVGHTDFEFMIYCLKKIFLRYQEKGTVRLEYDTKLYFGKLE
ncbi:MAG TPA: class I SAM-dependent methyltransferase [Nitrosopumilaceae archaeon]|jgi:ubiquinone/menaquinone biosynthesis C-methylase UbiE|nr:class I SAM-dependent methyltransferase [Nitrosopumilaceae archaeon]